MSSIGLLDHLPAETFQLVLTFLKTSNLVQLHVASAAELAPVRQRLFVMKCGRHWLHLTRRVSSAIAGKEFDGFHVRGRYRKVVLLAQLKRQIQHINNIATFIDSCLMWQSQTYYSKAVTLIELGLSGLLGHDENAGEDEFLHVVQQLDMRIKQMFLIDENEFCFSLAVECQHGDKTTRSKSSASGSIEKSWNEINHKDEEIFARTGLLPCQLSFLCILHVLQQMPPEAVLARFHGMLSRCCRYDLLIESRILPTYLIGPQAWTQQTPADDILAALDQHEQRHNWRGYTTLVLPDGLQSNLPLKVAAVVNSFTRLRAANRI